MRFFPRIRAAFPFAAFTEHKFDPVDPRGSALRQAILSRMRLPSPLTDSTHHHIELSLPTGARRLSSHRAERLLPAR
jgi:hypothetical protein